MGKPPDELDALRRKTREAMKRLRDSVDLEDYDGNDPDSTVKIHAIGSTVTIQHTHGGSSSSAVNEPPETPEPTGVTVLKLLPVWGRVLVVSFTIASAAIGGHTLGWW